MVVNFDCPFCTCPIEADAELQGDRAECPDCGHVILVPAAGIDAGTELAGYRVIRRLGTGGMGDVFLAEQLAMGRKVALKVLPPAMTGKKELVKRFLQEIRMAARLEHPNIVTAFDAGNDGSIYYLAMSYVEGEDLHDRIDRLQRLPEKDALEILLKVCRALKYAWEKHKILHRDIKPANIMIDRDGDVKLMDMGIAKSLEEDTSLTMKGVFIGTPNYMSPEQAKASPDLDFRSDIYSLGATFYHMVTGDKPFDGPNAVTILSKHLTEPLPSPKSKVPELSDTTCHIISMMMAKKPQRRYQTWDDLIADTELVLAQDPRTLELAIPKDVLEADVDDTKLGPPQPLTVAYRETVQGTAAAIPLRSATLGQAAHTTDDAPRRDHRHLPPPSDEVSQLTGMLRQTVILVLLAVIFAIGAGIWYIYRANTVEEAQRIAQGRRVVAQNEEDIVAEVEGALVERATRMEIEAKAEQQQKQLAEMIQVADAFAKANPFRPGDAIAKFEKIRRYAQGTKYELIVDDHIAALRKTAATAPERILARLAKEADAHAEAHQYDNAAATYSDYNGPFAEQTAAARDHHAAVWNTRHRHFEAAIDAVDAIRADILQLDFTRIAQTLDEIRRRPDYASNPFYRETAAELDTILQPARLLFASYERLVSQNATIRCIDTRGHTIPTPLRIDAVSGFSLTVRHQDTPRTLNATKLSHEEFIARIPREIIDNAPLLKGLLAARIGQYSAAKRQFQTAAGPTALLLTGHADANILAGTWHATAFSGVAYQGKIKDVRLALAADHTFSLTLSGGRTHRGTCRLLAGRILFRFAENRRDTWAYRTPADDQLLLFPKPGIQVTLARR